MLSTPISCLSYPNFSLSLIHDPRKASSYRLEVCRMALVGDIRQYEDSQNSLEVQELAKFAVEDYNKKQNALLEFQKVLNVKEQVVSGIMYYITMEVKDGDKKKVYEAKVWEKLWENFKKVQEFKLIGDA